MTTRIQDEYEAELCILKTEIVRLKVRDEEKNAAIANLKRMLWNMRHTNKMKHLTRADLAKRIYDAEAPTKTSEAGQETTCSVLTFTAVECSHLLNILLQTEDRGEYYGNRDQYWKRNKRIEDKLRAYIGVPNAGIDTPNPPPPVETEKDKA